MYIIHVARRHSLPIRAAAAVPLLRKVATKLQQERGAILRSICMCISMFVYIYVYI